MSSSSILNGILVATRELKNPLTGQTVEEARRQYMQDRDPRETIFEFKRRTLVHFAGQLPRPAGAVRAPPG